MSRAPSGPQPTINAPGTQPLASRTLSLSNLRGSGVPIQRRSRRGSRKTNVQGGSSLTGLLQLILDSRNRKEDLAFDREVFEADKSSAEARLVEVKRQFDVTTTKQQIRDVKADALRRMQLLLTTQRNTANAVSAAAAGTALEAENAKDLVERLAFIEGMRQLKARQENIIADLAIADLSTKANSDVRVIVAAERALKLNTLAQIEKQRKTAYTNLEISGATLAPAFHRGARANLLGTLDPELHQENITLAMFANGIGGAQKALDFLRGNPIETESIANSPGSAQKIGIDHNVGLPASVAANIAGHLSVNVARFMEGDTDLTKDETEGVKKWLRQYQDATNTRIDKIAPAAERVAKSRGLGQHFGRVAKRTRDLGKTFGLGLVTAPTSALLNTVSPINPRKIQSRTIAEDMRLLLSEGGVDALRQQLTRENLIPAPAVNKTLGKFGLPAFGPGTDPQVTSEDTGAYIEFLQLKVMSGMTSQKLTGDNEAFADILTAGASPDARQPLIEGANNFFNRTMFKIAKADASAAERLQHNAGFVPGVNDEKVAADTRNLFDDPVTAEAIRKANEDLGTDLGAAKARILAQLELANIRVQAFEENPSIQNKADMDLFFTSNPGIVPVVRAQLLESNRGSLDKALAVAEIPDKIARDKRSKELLTEQLVNQYKHNSRVQSDPDVTALNRAAAKGGLDDGLAGPTDPRFNLARAARSNPSLGFLNIAGKAARESDIGRASRDLSQKAMDQAQARVLSLKNKAEGLEAVSNEDVFTDVAIDNLPDIVASIREGPERDATVATLKGMIDNFNNRLAIMRENLPSPAERAPNVVPVGQPPAGQPPGVPGQPGAAPKAPGQQGQQTSSTPAANAIGDRNAQLGNNLVPKVSIPGAAAPPPPKPVVGSATPLPVGQ